MTTLQTFLTAKRSLEDRALNRVVWHRFVEELSGRASSEEPVRILEIGLGTGSMIARLAEWEALPLQVTYRAIDIDPETLAVARRKLPERLQTAGYTVETTDNVIRAHKESTGPDRTLEITLETGDAFETTDHADAVIASAVLDLVELSEALEAITQLCADDGLLYAPFTFNGHTSFRPSEPADPTIERLYHRHMDEIREQPGGSRAGQQLLTALPAAGYRILEAGGADWVVHPTDGVYPADEAVVLEFLCSTIDSALAEYPPTTLDPETRTRWINKRREQLESGELTLVAHHMDVLAELS